MHRGKRSWDHIHKPLTLLTLFSSPTFHFPHAIIFYCTTNNFPRTLPLFYTKFKQAYCFLIYLLTFVAFYHYSTSKCYNTDNGDTDLSTQNHKQDFSTLLADLIKSEGIDDLVQAGGASKVELGVEISPEGTPFISNLKLR